MDLQLDYRFALVLVTPLTASEESLVAVRPIIVRRSFMSTILIIVLVLLLIGALPTWPYSSGWGYYPSGGLGLVVLVLVVLLLMGRL
jgi:hypothetical protein